jgi:DNA (cytosine-5)-methyltransferase 1
MEGLNFIDLFCGVGGFRQALGSLGHTCVFSSDWDKDARETYQANYDELPAGDITKIEADEVPMHQVLCGGFPCQPFSISGKMNGFGDARGTLLYEILRIASRSQTQGSFFGKCKKLSKSCRRQDNGHHFVATRGGRIQDILSGPQCIRVRGSAKKGAVVFCLFSKRSGNYTFSFSRASK